MFNRTEILRAAWADYRRDVFQGLGVRRGERFSRKHFAYCLRMAWAVAKDVAAKATEPAPAHKAAKVMAPAAAARIQVIAAELEWMEYGDRTDWTKRAALAAETNRLAA